MKGTAGSAITAVTRAAWGLLGGLIVAAGCNQVTGASGYDEVSHCTGPLCGVCPAGQVWVPGPEACVAAPVGCVLLGGRWDGELGTCIPKGTCPAGQRWYEGNDSCVLECGEGATACGLICCGFGLSCLADSTGAPLCNACATAEQVCGAACCDPGAICSDVGRGACRLDPGVLGQSCAGGLLCGENDRCCASTTVPGGTFLMGSPESDEDAGPGEFPEHEVTVSSFELDKYEVTVGRFRRFIELWDYNPLPAGAGAHPRIPGSGWRTSWNKWLPEGPTVLGESVSLGDDLLPVAAATWYEAFAFCVWDGGRLPTEAESEYAAVGGDENRKYPWGLDSLTTDRAVYSDSPIPTERAPVGSKAAGAGRWGHLDLVGNVAEWVLDVYDDYSDGKVCDDCATTSADLFFRVGRGGSCYDEARLALRGAHRSPAMPNNRVTNLGFRCARSK